MKKSRSVQIRKSAFDPVYNIASIFAAHRDLRPYAKLTLGDSGLSVEEADILIILLGVRELGWDDCPVDENGFVTFHDLKSVLVHDASLFARRLKKLAAPGCAMVEVRRITKQAAPRLHGNAQQVRITKIGIAAAKPIWERFRKLSAKLFASEHLSSFAQAEFEAHMRVNDAISRTLHEWRDPAKGVL
jgi:hypothetical protein